MQFRCDLRTEKLCGLTPKFEHMIVDGLKPELASPKLSVGRVQITQQCEFSLVQKHFKLHVLLSSWESKIVVCIEVRPL